MTKGDASQLAAIRLMLAAKAAAESGQYHVADQDQDVHELSRG